MKERIIQKFNYRHMICICITLAFFACTVLIFDNAIGRIAEAFKDFGLSVAYYFTELLGFEGLIEPTVNNSAKVPFFNVDISDWINNLFNNKGAVPPAVTPPAPPTAVLPSTWELFKVDAERYFKLLVDTENLNNYLHNITEVLKMVLLVVSLLLPLFISIKIQIRRIIEKKKVV